MPEQLVAQRALKIGKNRGVTTMVAAYWARATFLQSVAIRAPVKGDGVAVKTRTRGSAKSERVPSTKPGDWRPPLPSAARDRSSRSVPWRLVQNWVEVTLEQAPKVGQFSPEAAEIKARSVPSRNQVCDNRNAICGLLYGPRKATNRQKGGPDLRGCLGDRGEDRGRAVGRQRL